MVPFDEPIYYRITKNPMPPNTVRSTTNNVDGMGPHSFYITAAAVTSHAYWDMNNYKKVYFPKEQLDTKRISGYVSLKKWYGEIKGMETYVCPQNMTAAVDMNWPFDVMKDN